MIRQWFKTGTPWIWLNAGALAIALVAVLGLLLLIVFRGMSHFWPANVEAFYYENGQNSLTVIAEIVESEIAPIEALYKFKGMHGEDVLDLQGTVTRYLVKTGNRDVLGTDFRWLYDIDLVKREQPKNIMALERVEWGNFYGYLDAIYEKSDEKEDKQGVDGSKPEGGRKLVVSNEAAGEEAVWAELKKRLQRSNDIRDQILQLEKGGIGAINHQLERLRLKERRLQLDDELTADAINDLAEKRSEERRVGKEC